jgi:hypothetical protein
VNGAPSPDCPPPPTRRQRRAYHRSAASPVNGAPLETAVARGLLCRDGAGRDGDPYRYWLPQKEAQFASDLRCRLDDLHRAQLLSLPPGGGVAVAGGGVG